MWERKALERWVLGRCAVAQRRAVRATAIVTVAGLVAGREAVTAGLGRGAGGSGEGYGGAEQARLHHWVLMVSCSTVEIKGMISQRRMNAQKSFLLSPRHRKVLYAFSLFLNV